MKTLEELLREAMARTKSGFTQDTLDTMTDSLKGKVFVCPDPPEGFEIIDFRIPKEGEWCWEGSSIAEPLRAGAPPYYRPRFILRKIKPKLLLSASGEPGTYIGFAYMDDKTRIMTEGPCIWSSRKDVGSTVPVRLSLIDGEMHLTDVSEEGEVE